MAVNPREIRITREDIAEWIKEWGKIKKSERPTLREYLGNRQEILDLPDREVAVGARDDIIGNSVDIVDYILMDIDTFLDPEKTDAAEIG